MSKITTTDFYNTYPNKYKISYVLFRKILITYFKLFGTAITEGYCLTFLNRLGSFRMVKKYNESTILSIDHYMTWQNKKKGDSTIVYRTNPYYFVPQWIRMSGYSFDYKHHFVFKPADNFLLKIRPNWDKLEISTLNIKAIGKIHKQ